jgi:hypothetical protein
MNNDLHIIYNKLKKFYSTNSIESIINTQCILTEINIKNDIQLSVVFTANNRVNQTYFSLRSWNNIALLNNINIQVIIIEDTKDLKLKIDIKKLNYSNLYINYIYIKNKNWINPCLNYNIGFKYIISNNVVLTNAETCVFGNIYTLIKDKLTIDNYLIFDVLEIGKSHCTTNINKHIWNRCSDFKYDTLQTFIKKKRIRWLQSKARNRKYHFLTCINNNTLQKIGGFDLEFALNIAYDDNNLLSKIINLHNIIPVNVFHDEHKIIGLHQWHSRCYNNYVGTDLEKYNKLLYNLKHKYILKNNKYINITDYNNYEILQNIIFEK